VREPLHRSREDRILFGVAGGMAEWLDLDPAIVRLVWALLILAGGVGLLLYVIAAFVIPEAPLGQTRVPQSDEGPGSAAQAGAGGAAGPADPRAARRAGGRGSGRPAMVFGLILVVLGAWFLLRRYIPALDPSWFVPGALIVVGLILVVGALGRGRDGA
jgi:phage shock protein C